MSTATLPAPAAAPPEIPEEDLCVRPRRWTREEYYRAAELGLFREGERLELVDGEILEKMSPGNPPHATAVGKVWEALRRVFGSEFVVRAQAALVLSDYQELEPDILVVPGSLDDYAERHPTPQEARLVVEVSDTTLAYDQGRKAALYAEAGIADYWLLNLRQRTLEVRRDPIALPPGSPFPFGYRTTTTYLEGDAVTPLVAPQASVKVADLLPRS